jgi:hypothetical protein
MRLSRRLLRHFAPQPRFIGEPCDCCTPEPGSGSTSSRTSTRTRTCQEPYPCVNSEFPEYVEVEITGITNDYCTECNLFNGIWICQLDLGCVLQVPCRWGCIISPMICSYFFGIIVSYEHIYGINLVKRFNIYFCYSSYGLELLHFRSNTIDNIPMDCTTMNITCYPVTPPPTYSCLTQNATAIIRAI